MHASGSASGPRPARLRAVALVALVALLGDRPAFPEDPPSAPAPVVDEASFLSALQRMKTALAAGRAVEGLTLLDATLAAHEGKDYVLAKRVELEDLARRLSFAETCPPPDPKTLVEGELRKWISKTGEIEIRYRDGRPTDLKSEGGGLLFPARFRGAYTVTVKGSSYPSQTSQAPIVQVGWEKDARGKVRGWAVSFGVPPYDQGNQRVWLPARIVSFEGDDEKVLVEKATSPGRPGKPFRLDVVVQSSRVTASLDGTIIGSAPKNDSVFGFAWIKVPDWGEITISGLVEPSWIQSKVDAVVDKGRAAFDKRFDVRKRLPAWLYARPAPASSTPSPAPTAGGPSPSGSSPSSGSSPGSTKRAPTGIAAVPAALRATYMAGLAKARAGDGAGALAAAEELEAKGAPVAVAAMLAAEACLLLDDSTKALAHLDRVLAADPDAFEAFVLKTRLLGRLGRDADLVATVAAARARPDASLDVFEAAGLALLFAGRLDDARSCVEDATRRGRRSPTLETVARVVVRAKNGPDWPRTFEARSANYRVVSDIDQDTCRKAATVLEEALGAFRSRVGMLQAEPKRLYDVFLFSGEAGFQRYVADSALLSGKGPERAAGLYSGVMKQLLIWNLPNRDEMMSTVRHEGFHQYLDRLMPDPPVWLNEGMAVYFEVVPPPGGELHLERPRADQLDALKDKPLVPLEAFTRIKPKEFYATAPQSYAQAWLLVHMLHHGSTKHRELRVNLMKRLLTQPGSEAVREAFVPSLLPTLDADLLAYRVALAAKR
jgi:hypothetical protein